MSIKNWAFPIIYILLAISIEIATFVSMGIGIIPEYWLLDLTVMMSIAAIIYIIPSRAWQIAVLYIFAFIQILVSYINVTLHAMFADLFSFDMLTLASEAFKVWNASFLRVGYLIAIICILSVSIIAVVNVSKRVDFGGIWTRKVAGMMALIFVGTQLFAVSGYNIQISNLYEGEDDEYSEYYDNDTVLYDLQHLKVESLKKFGTFGYLISNISNVFFDTVSEQDISDADDYLNGDIVYQTNDMTATLTDDNVIVIMVESLEWYGVAPMISPNLYNLSEEGIMLSEYYSKSKTNYSENAFLLGHLAPDSASASDYISNNSDSYAMSVVNMYNNAGYETSYFHSNEGSFYDRVSTHYTYGFENFYAIEDMDIAEEDTYPFSSTGEYTLDSDMFEACVEDIAPVDSEDPFFSYVTTLSMHGPYYTVNNLAEYYDMLDDGVFEEYEIWLEENTEYTFPVEEEYIEYIYNYLAKVMDFDIGLGILMDYLMENQLIEDTTILLYGDHNAYYHDLTYTMNDLSISEIDNVSLYRVPAIIYSNDLNDADDIDAFSCPYDLPITMMDLCGIEYNNNLYYGYSVYNENHSDQVFISKIGGVMTNLIYTDNLKSFVYDEDIVSDEDIATFVKNATAMFAKQEAINNIYNTKILVNNIDKYYSQIYI